MLYLGEINDSQRAAWRKTIEVFDEGASSSRTMALFPEDRPVEVCDDDVVQIRLKDLELRRPRQWGACWLACHLYEQLGLDQFWAERLQPSRKGTRWDLVTQALSCYRLIDPGSEWRLHRHWYDKSAMGDLLGAGFELAESHKLYACLDKLLEHKRALFDHLTQRWRDLFWVMDRGVPTEEILEEMRQSDPPIYYLVGTPKGRLSRYEKPLVEKPWCRVRDGVDVNSGEGSSPCGGLDILRSIWRNGAARGRHS